MHSLSARLSYLGRLWRQGLWGRWIASAWALYGVATATRDELFTPATVEKYRALKLLLDVPFAWWLVVASLIVIVWVFEASFRVERRAQEALVRLSPPRVLRLHFDPADPKCVQVMPGLYGATGEKFFVIVEVAGSRSLFDVKIRALESKFTDFAIIGVHRGSIPWSAEKFELLHRQVLHPGAPERIAFAALQYPGNLSPHDALGNMQHFSLEASARDHPAAILELVYDPAARPMIAVVQDKA